MSSDPSGATSGSEVSGQGPSSPPAAGRISIRDICCLLCCPPLPSSIVSKLAFMPPEASYRITDDNTMELLDNRVDWPHDRPMAASIEMLTVRTRRRNRIACAYIRPFANREPNFTLLFSHGNAVDIGQMSSFYYGLGSRTGCNVFSYDYSGYGCSNGKPSEKNLYADIAAAFEVLQQKFGVPANRVILYGQSIGTVPSVDLATRQEVAALVLHSPLMSGMRVAFPGTQRTWCCDAFPSIEKVPRVKCPTLVIHGTDDEIIDFSHGLSIYEKCPTSVEPLWVPGAGHNDVELHSAYLERLRNFIDTEAGRPPVYRAAAATVTNERSSGGTKQSSKKNTSPQQSNSSSASSSATNSARS